MVLASAVAGTLAAVTASLLAFAARELLHVAETVDANRERSQTNREALRAFIEQTDADLDTDPITGFSNTEED